MDLDQPSQSGLAAGAPLAKGPPGDIDIGKDGEGGIITGGIIAGGIATGGSVTGGSVTGGSVTGGNDTEVTERTSATGIKMSSLMLCVDGGASKCAAVIIDENGVLSRGESGPCNFTDLGVEGVIKPISAAVQQALGNIYVSGTHTQRIPHNTHSQNQQTKTLNTTQYQRSLQPPFTCFTTAWIGLAGCDRPEAAATLRPALRDMLGLGHDHDHDHETLSITNDVKLLAAGIKTHAETNTGVTLIAGTGSVAMSWNITTHMEIQQLGRTGGWGHVLGDEGAGYHIGRQGIRSTLTAWEQVQLGYPQDEVLGPLHRSLLETYGILSAADPNVDILSAFLGTSTADTVKDKEKNLKSHIAAAARIVLDTAAIDPLAAAIVTRAAEDLAQLVIPLVRGPRGISPEKSTLVLGGGLWRNEGYKKAVLGRLAEHGVEFAHVEVVREAAVAGAEYLLQMAR